MQCPNDPPDGSHDGELPDHGVCHHQVCQGELRPAGLLTMQRHSFLSLIPTLMSIQDTNYFKEDIVIPPKQAEEDMGLTFGDSHVEGNVGFGPNEDFVDSKTKEKVESHGHAAST